MCGCVCEVVAQSRLYDIGRSDRALTALRWICLRRSSQDEDCPGYKGQINAQRSKIQGTSDTLSKGSDAASPEHAVADISGMVSRFRELESKVKTELHGVSFLLNLAVQTRGVRQDIERPRAAKLCKDDLLMIEELLRLARDMTRRSEAAPQVRDPLSAWNFIHSRRRPSGTRRDAHQSSGPTSSIRSLTKPLIVSKTDTKGRLTYFNDQDSLTRRDLPKPS